MPLPTAPAKRAALLSERDYGIPARSAPGPRRPEPSETTAAATIPATAAAAGTSGAERAPGSDRKKGSTRGRTPAPQAQPTRLAAPAVPVAAPASLAAVTASAPPTKARKPKHTGPAKLFVLDTNVLLHDPMCLFRFEEHDIFLPMIVLEELDGHKKGMTEVARNARQTSRTLDALAGHQGSDITAGLPLNATGHRTAGGKLFFQTQLLTYTLPTSLPQGKADNQILGVVESLRQQHSPREVVLVSKDINMRVKARALGLATDDYQNDKTLEDGDLLYAGALALPPDFWTTHGSTVESWQQGANTFYRITGPIVPQLLINQFVYFEAPGEPSLYARVTEIRGTTAVFKTLKDYTHLKNSVWGITTRNREQNFAMNLLMDPEIDFVTLTGTVKLAFLKPITKFESLASGGSGDF